MKTFKNTLSPFIMLLVPLFLLMGILAVNMDNEIPAGRQRASVKFEAPTLKILIQAIVKK